MNTGEISVARQPNCEVVVNADTYVDSWKPSKGESGKVLPVRRGGRRGELFNGFVNIERSGVPNGI